jgi:deoxycytidylate deaminase
VVQGWKIIGLGYNGFARGIPSTTLRWSKGKKDEYLQHAETNALNFSHFERKRKYITLYVTCVPCEKCALYIQQMQVQRVVYNIGVEKYLDRYNTYLK